MAAFYPHPAGDGPALLVLRVVFGSAMIAAIVLAISAIGQRNFAAHSAG